MPNQGSQIAQKPAAVKPLSPVTPTPIRVVPASAGGSVPQGVAMPVKIGAPVTARPIQPAQQTQPTKPIQPLPFSPQPPIQPAPQQQIPKQPPTQALQPPKEQAGFKPAAPSDVKQSPFRFLPLVLGALLLVGGLWFVITRFFSGMFAPKTTQNTTQNAPAPVKQTTLAYWGLWEASPVLDQVIKDFQTQNAGVIINYVQQSPQEYRERLQDALQKGQSPTAPIGTQIGPDVFRYHATWVPMLKNQLSALPSNVMSSAEFGQTFYPVAVKQATTTNGIVGIPRM